MIDLYFKICGKRKHIDQKDFLYLDDGIHNFGFNQLGIKVDNRKDYDATKLQILVNQALIKTIRDFVNDNDIIAEKKVKQLQNSLKGFK